MASANPMNPSLRLLLAGLVMCSLMACTKTATLRQENAEVMQRVNDIQAKIRQIESETANLNPLGQFNITHPAHLDGFKNQVEISKVRIKILRDELATAQKEADNALQEFNAYMERHRTL